MATMSYERYTASRMSFADPDCQRMYERIMDVIQAYTGCSDTSRFYALNPYIVQIWARATEAQRDNTIPHGSRNEGLVTVTVPATETAICPLL